MSAAGKYRSVVEFWSRTSQYEWALALSRRAHITTPEQPQSEQFGLRAPRITLMDLRHTTLISVGMLALHQGQYYAVEAIEDRAERGRELRLSCREFVGIPAIYKPQSGSDASCFAWFSRSNDYTGWEQKHNEPSLIVELLQAQLAHPWGVPGDGIEIGGVDYTVDGVIEDSEDNYITRFKIRQS